MDKQEFIRDYVINNLHDFEFNQQEVVKAIKLASNKDKELIRDAMSVVVLNGNSKPLQAVLEDVIDKRIAVLALREWRKHNGN